MKSVEVKAKTVHEAIADACEQLGVAQDEVSVEILSQGGMFGKAKVLVTVKEEFTKKETLSTNQTPEPNKEIEPKTKKEKRGAAPEVSSEASARDEDMSERSLGKAEQASSAVAKTAARNTQVASHMESKPFNPDSPKFTKTLAFVTKFIELLENDSTVTSEMTDKSFNINVNGENIGRLIGKGGEVLNAIQTIVSSIAISNSDGQNKRVYVNIGDYKERRGDTLQSLAIKKAEYVKTSGRFVKLDPMNSRERAIIHTALSEIEGIRTYSTGKDPFRCLCIAPADKQDNKDKPAKTTPENTDTLDTDKKDA